MEIKITKQQGRWIEEAVKVTVKDGREDSTYRYEENV